MILEQSLRPAGWCMPSSATKREGCLSVQVVNDRILEGVRTVERLQDMFYSSRFFMPQCAVRRASMDFT